MKTFLRLGFAVLVGSFMTVQAWAASSSPQSIIKEALLGAGTGALSAELSGGKAGKGALIGAGTNVIGGALFGALFDSPSSSSGASYGSSYSYAPQYVPTAQTTYAQPVYNYQPQDVVYVQAAPASYANAPQTDSNRMIIRQGLLGAGVGAISAEASGGKAGTGALVGAGTNIIGGALFDTLLAPTASPAQRSVYYQPPLSSPSTTYGNSGQKKIVRHYDASGKIVSEEEYFI